MRRILEIDGSQTLIRLSLDDAGYTIHDGDRTFRCALLPDDRRGGFMLDIDGRRLPIRIAVGRDATFVQLDGRAYQVDRIDPAERFSGQAAGTGGNRLLAPMPGVVVSLAAKVGDRVAKGQPILVIESMKLETTLGAPCDGIVVEIPFGAAQGFGHKDVLARVQQEDD